MKDILTEDVQDSKVDEYMKFDFKRNPQYKRFLNKLKKVPDGLLLKKLQRAFYKEVIDPEFVVNFDGIDQKVIKICLE